MSQQKQRNTPPLLLTLKASWCCNACSASFLVTLQDLMRSPLPLSHHCSRRQWPPEPDQHVAELPQLLQVNRDGEPMRAQKLEFSLLPHRLKVHMANKDLLVQPSQTLKAGKQTMDRKVKAAALVCSPWLDAATAPRASQFHLPILCSSSMYHEAFWSLTVVVV